MKFKLYEEDVLVGEFLLVSLVNELAAFSGLSRSDIRRRWDGGAITVEGNKPQKRVQEGFVNEHTRVPLGGVVKFGKRNFVKFV